MTLPRLRDELDLLPGPTLADGQPSHTLHDPVRNQFFQLDWPTFEILRYWHLDDPALIVEVVRQTTTLDLQVDDVLAVAGFLHDNQLLQPGQGKSKEFAALLKRHKGSRAQWLLHNYLFFRIPLIHPDRWLGPLAAKLDWIFSKEFGALTLLAMALGMLGVYREWDEFTTTLVDTLSWAGLASYGVALVGVKVLHELGHAITAKRYGCRVPTMGIAFLVMWPMAYTDTNEVWKLTSKQQRMRVAAAGVLTELTVAVWATVAWIILPLGMPKSMAFMLATTTWISSITINASPFMRFDGYYWLSDWLEMPNLHARAFALARWDLRERLFGWGDEIPEVLPAARTKLLIIFAYATWLYRLVIFLGIAALVYAFFIKAVGILLFLVEILWFVLLPPAREILVWRKRWPELRNNPVAQRHGAIVILVLAILALPWPSRVASLGILRPGEQWIIYAPQRAQLQSIYFADGAEVPQGAAVMQLRSAELDNRKIAATARQESMRWQATSGAFDADARARWQLSQGQLGTANAELAAVNADNARYAPLAPFSGVVRDLEPDLRIGEWLNAQEPLGRIVSHQRWQVVTYLDEDELTHIAVGDTARFYAEGQGGPWLSLQVLRIDSDASRTLHDEMLANLYGGDVPVREKKGVLYPEHSVYRVLLQVSGDSTESSTHVWRGKVVIHGNWSVPGWRYVLAALNMLRRESGF